jgi:hypothetical protein
MRLVMFWKNSFHFYEVSTSFPEKKNTFLLAKFIFAPSDGKWKGNEESHVNGKGKT